MPTLHILRAGTPQPQSERWGTAFAIEIAGEIVMIDCGPCATGKLVDAGLALTDVNWLFFTHHHSDHNADYPGLMLFRWDQCTGEEPPLQVIGPPPTEHVTERLFGDDGAFRDDIAARINHPASEYWHTRRGGSLPRPGPAFEARDVSPGDEIDGPAWTARCAEVDHMQPWLRTYAWRFDWDGGSICFSSDTTSRGTVSDLAAGVDTLVAHVPLRQERQSDDLPASTYGTIDAAQVAAASGAERLVLAHLTGGLIEEREAALADISQAYDGETIIAEELMSLDV
ncbi:MAG: MBL fold metallo-hydrolase [Armatimonadota bacterium]